jgi:periplasmic protein TonB
MMSHNWDEPKRFLPGLAVSLALLGHGTAIGALMLIDREGAPQLPTRVLSARIVIERPPVQASEPEAVAPPDTPAPQLPKQPSPPQPKVVSTAERPVKKARQTAPKVEASAKRTTKRTSQAVPDKTTHDVAKPTKSEKPAPAPAQVAGVSSEPVKATNHSHAPPAVVAPRFEADYLSNPAPVYPRKSRYLGEEGRVLLKVRVSESGDAMEVSLHRSSGFKRLDRAALDAVQQWKFIPARQGRKQVMAWVVVPLEFSLRRTL